MVCSMIFDESLCFNVLVCSVQHCGKDELEFDDDGKDCSASSSCFLSILLFSGGAASYVKLQLTTARLALVFTSLGSLN